MTMLRPCSTSPILMLAVLAFAACSDDNTKSPIDSGPTDGALIVDAPRTEGSLPGDGKLPPTDGPIVPSDGTPPIADSAPPPPPTCTPPITLIDTSAPNTKVGMGTAASCTAAALASELAKGGVITFDCGAAPVTIKLDAAIVVPTDKDTVLDGGGKITLDGQNKTRLLELVRGDYRKNTKKLTLQRLTFRNAKASGTDFTPQDPQNPDCAYGYKDGGGGVILVRDTVLHVIDCVFENNAAASPGPDVGGGAIYALGSLDVTVVGSTFQGNQASNGGAVGLLQTTGTFVNTTFIDNKATGDGANYVKAGCPGVGHQNQGGAGGNGGAIAIDGADDLEQSFCGVTFKSNRSNQLGGCVFRTANGQQRKATFRLCTMDGNSAEDGGGCLYISNSDFTLAQSLVSNNVVDKGAGGGVRTELNSKATIVNTTFYGNSSPQGLMGALSHGGPGEIRNCTFADNKAEGGPTLFTAALGPAGPVKVYNTVFLNNATKEPYNPQACWFQPKEGGNNFQWPRKRFGGSIDDTACVNGIRWEDAKLGPLADNGGPTLTLLPQAGSPVVGAGADCPDVDQRGQARQKASCAAGAVEP